MENDLIQKSIRDLFNRSVNEVLIQGSKAYNTAVEFMGNILPAEVHKVKKYTQTTPIFSHFKVEEQIAALYQPTVPLPSGGYIVINPTEALIAIDINSGKSISESNIEETALKTNLEAAKEIARQLKLREISGLIVIDFIDMQELRNRKIVERSLKNYLSQSRARVQTTHISEFGLLEMSRQRLSPSFLETYSSTCTNCNGKGVVRSPESNGMLILRTVENELLNSKVDIVQVFANIDAITCLSNNNRADIMSIEKKYNIKLNVHYDPKATAESFSIEKIKTSKVVINDSELKPAVISSDLFCSKGWSLFLK